MHILLESYKEFIFSLPFVGCTNDIEWLLCSGALIAKTGGPCGSFLSLHPMAFQIFDGYRFFEMEFDVCVIGLKNVVYSTQFSSLKMREEHWDY